MKKILLFSLFIASSTAMTSCTADSLSDTLPTQIHADDTGGQNGQIPPPPPKPPFGG